MRKGLPDLKARTGAAKPKMGTANLPKLPKPVVKAKAAPKRKDSYDSEYSS